MQSDCGSTDTAVSPLLFRHAMPRTSSADLEGHYDPAAQVWVLETSSGSIPVVQAGCSDFLDTQTATRVRQEADDEDISNDTILVARMTDTSTLTKVRQEGDDTDLSCDESLGNAPAREFSLAELATKTDVQQESDDQINASGVLELETRSVNNQEGIDEDWPELLLELQTKIFVNVEEDDDCSLHH